MKLKSNQIRFALIALVLMAHLCATTPPGGGGIKNLLLTNGIAAEMTTIRVYTRIFNDDREDVIEVSIGGQTKKISVSQKNPIDYVEFRIPTDPTRFRYELKSKTTLSDGKVMTGVCERGSNLSVFKKFMVTVYRSFGEETGPRPELSPWSLYLQELGP